MIPVEGGRRSYDSVIKFRPQDKTIKPSNNLQREAVQERTTRYKKYSPAALTLLRAQLFTVIIMFSCFPAKWGRNDFNIRYTTCGCQRRLLRPCPGLPRKEGGPPRVRSTTVNPTALQKSPRASLTLIPHRFCPRSRPSWTSRLYPLPKPFPVGLTI